MQGEAEEKKGKASVGDLDKCGVGMGCSSEGGRRKPATWEAVEDIAGVTPR